MVTRETEHLNRLIEAATAVSATLDLERVADATLEAALRLVDAAHGAVFLDRGDLLVHAHRGPTVQLGPLSDAARRAVDVRGAVDFDAEALIAVPFFDGDRALGAVAVIDPAVRGDRSAVRLLEVFARDASRSLAHARRFRAEQLINEQFGTAHDIGEEFRGLNKRT